MTGLLASKQLARFIDSLPDDEPPQVVECPAENCGVFMRWQKYGMMLQRIFASLLLAVVALLVAAWIATFFGQVGIGTRSGPIDRHVAFRSGNLSVSQHGNYMRQGLFWSSHLPPDPEEPSDLTPLSTRLRFTRNADGWIAEIPILFLITALAPLVYGISSGFRFRLWHFLAYIALVAVELAWFVI